MEKYITYLLDKVIEQEQTIKELTEKLEHSERERAHIDSNYVNPCLLKDRDDKIEELEKEIWKLKQQLQDKKNAEGIPLSATDAATTPKPKESNENRSYKTHFNSYEEAKDYAMMNLSVTPEPLRTPQDIIETFEANGLTLYIAK